MTKIFLNKKTCSGCGQCVRVCPMKEFSQKITESETSVPSVPETEENGCIDCGHCVASCPTRSITVGKVMPENLVSLDRKKIPDYNAFRTLVLARRSVRCYQNCPIETDKMDRLFDLMRWTPTARNLLPVRWLAINNFDKVHQLAGLVIDEMRPDERLKPLVDAWDAGIDMIHRGAPCLIVAYTESDALWPVADCSIAVETMELAAVTLELGSCWAGFFLRYAEKSQKIRKFLGLTSENQLGAALLLGYPDDEEYADAPYRPNVPVRYL